ncbi:hypothetical protein [Candidatus Albibeggiatoa sp. nov. NOAA]|uniref:hypothetical protein n=1 Tax=Candidatus Albibeggiatoa sp. nov. NOAA TaxID=3162724 RepID=UPI0032FB60DF|nr:hypothetical protein [Thiotrichaceae bacterium]
MNQLLSVTFLLSLLIANTSALAAAKCWTDYDGILNCGNVVPPEFSQKGYTERDKNGLVVNKIGRAKTSEEIAEEKRQREERALKYKECLAERDKDREVLNLFNTEDGIENERMNRLDTLDATIEVIRSQIARSEKNLNDMQRNLESSYNNNAVTEKERERLRMNIESVEKNINNFEKNLIGKYEEKQSENSKFDVFLQRFRRIQRDGRVNCSDYAPQQEELIPQPKR